MRRKQLGKNEKCNIPIYPNPHPNEGKNRGIIVGGKDHIQTSIHHSLNLNKLGLFSLNYDNAAKVTLYLHRHDLAI